MIWCWRKPGSPISTRTPWRRVMRFILISSSIEPAMIARRSMLLGLGAVVLPVPGRAEMPVRIACHDGPGHVAVAGIGIARRCRRARRFYLYDAIQCRAGDPRPRAGRRSDGAADRLVDHRMARR